MRHSTLLLVSLVTLGMSVVACHAEPAGPAVPAPPGQDITGTYVATTFTIQDTQLRDVLALGGSLQLNLLAGGATTGQLFIPASVAGGNDFSASMTGTYRVSGTTVQFDQSAPTFVRDMDFVVSGNTLRGSGTTATGIVLTVVLTRR